SDQKAQAVDPMIVDALRNRLFGPPQAGGPGMDLASLNIQRGRDHNIATYNEMREAMGYHRIESFDDPVFQDGVGERLAQVYDSPDEIDLWVGGLAEKQLGNSMLGETFTAIVDEQFGRTAAADPNFYTKTASSEEIAWLNQLSLADVVRANSSDAFIDNTPFTVD
ncbi:MAG: peroxidase family protein, partial [Pseudomonadota bacterium]